MSGYESPDPQTEWTGEQTEWTGDPDATRGTDPDLAVGTPSDGDATGGADPGTPADMGADDELTVEEGAGRPRGNPPVPDADRPITD